MSPDKARVLVVMLSVVAVILVGLVVLEVVQAVRSESAWSGVAVLLGPLALVGLGIALLVPQLRR
ncbi:hypothetical protein F8271_28215 [Micromonospora sp. ALFpr18c]|uniref:hypothetical protein n=1 Tax=unclassified Micromonospora TaxID=2617518 RepID=UPI00124BB6DF|nr:hypothetical protein [Micromonospora sp. ALFpr18c]KAB1929896.1 hypothetical protein F8271_28215 [Micromonospora sp. ALFpr18c]